VSALFTDVNAIIGTDFFMLANVELDLDVRKLWLLKSVEINHDSEEAE
jgi:hypothetical protein